MIYAMRDIELFNLRGCRQSSPLLVEQNMVQTCQLSFLSICLWLFRSSLGAVSKHTAGTTE